MDPCPHGLLVSKLPQLAVSLPSLAINLHIFETPRMRSVFYQFSHSLLMRTNTLPHAALCKSSIEKKKITWWQALCIQSPLGTPAPHTAVPIRPGTHFRPKLPVDEPGRAAADGLSGPLPPTCGPEQSSWLLVAAGASLASAGLKQVTSRQTALSD